MGQETTDIATLAGGCFWCLEAVYDQVNGVRSVESGYIGGQVDAPTYEQVCGGHTGHAEAVRITFDPRLVTYRDLLNVFFVIHDPTTRNRQGNDIGTQYRSGIFYHSPEQQQIAQEVIAAVTRERVYPNPIVTEVVPATGGMRPKPITRSILHGIRLRATAPTSSGPKWPSFVSTMRRCSRRNAGRGGFCRYEGLNRRSSPSRMS
jgi:peptide-methionine (S)-S-oxide reductase